MTDPAAKSPQKPVQKTVVPGKTAVKPAAKGKGGMPNPVLVKIMKLPKPVLGGAIAGIVLVIFLAMNMGGTHKSAPVQQAAAPAAESAPQTDAEKQALDATNIPYVGPVENSNLTAVDDTIPMINRIGDDVLPLKREVLASREDYFARSDEFQTEDMEGDKFLAYRVRLPKGWLRVTQSDIKEQQLNNRLMGVIDYFVSPPEMDMRSSFRIKAQRMAHMMSARDWVLQYAFANRYTLQGMSTYGDDRAETMYVVNEADISYNVRVAVVVNGPRVVISEYFVPMQLFEKSRDDQTWAVTTFTLKYKDAAPSENTKSLMFFDLATMDYPASWELQRTNIQSIDLMNASIVNVQKEVKNIKTLLQGRIDVLLMATGEDFTMDRVMEKLNDIVKVDKLLINEKVGRFEITKNNSGLEPIKSDVYRINNVENSYQDYQYWVAVYKGKNYYFIVALLNPPRSYNPYIWSRNLGGFEYIMKTMHEGA
jgi:hypothetical protein